MWFTCWVEGGGVWLCQENTLSLVGGWDMVRVIGVGQ